MRYLLLITLGLIGIFIKISGQDSGYFSFDEYSISFNRSTLHNDNTENRNGFGFGANHLFRSDKKINLVFGLEFNRTSQFMKSMYEGHFANSTDLTYSMNCFSVPLRWRLNIGSKSNVYIETGVFADMVINSKKKGTMHIYDYSENSPIFHTETQYNERADLSSSFGLHGGFGIRVPFSSFECFINPDYKFGINKIYSYHDDIFNRYFRVNIGLKFK